ncbi:Metalloenzyme, LuxS/M16 peptidase-like protein, partial [Blyttiomyces helicus]
GKGTIHVRDVPNADNLNSAIEYYLQVGDCMKTETQALLRLYAQIVNEPCFNMLRTQEQLGAYQDFEDVISEMSDVEYNKHRTAVIAKLLEKYKNLGEESSQLWGHVSSGYYEFARNAEIAEIVKDIPKSAILDLYDMHISPSSLSRRKLSVHVRSVK